MSVLGTGWPHSPVQFLEGCSISVSQSWSSQYRCPACFPVPTCLKRLLKMLLTVDVDRFIWIGMLEDGNISNTQVMWPSRTWFGCRPVFFSFHATEDLRRETDLVLWFWSWPFFLWLLLFFSSPVWIPFSPVSCPLPRQFCRLPLARLTLCFIWKAFILLTFSVVHRCLLSLRASKQPSLYY